MSTTPRADRPPLERTATTHDEQGKRPFSAGRDRIRAKLLEHRRMVLAAAPAVVYLAIRLIGLLVLSWMSAANGDALVDNLRAWDGEWYLEIAAYGYGGVDPSMVDGFGQRNPETPLAFFPGYPALVAGLALLPGLTTTVAAVLVSLAFGVLAAYGLARLGRRLGGSYTAGLLLVALFASAPMSVVLSMTYSEAMFCALAVWALIGVLERNWLLAGVCCAASGLVRPTAAALIAVVMLAALVAVLRRRDGWWPWLGALLAPSGMLLYVGWVALQTSDVTGYFELQQHGWSSAFDGGVATAQFMGETLASDSSVLETFTVWIVLAALVLLALCVRMRMPWPLLAFTVAVLALDLGSDGLMYSKVRLMLPAFPLLIPVAVGMAHRRANTAVLTTTLLVLFGSWFGAYSLTAWDYAM